MEQNDHPTNPVIPMIPNSHAINLEIQCEIIRLKIQFALESNVNGVNEANIIKLTKKEKSFRIMHLILTFTL